MRSRLRSSAASTARSRSTSPGRQPLATGSLDLWLGDRDDLCVVGDDYQSIYAFTGAGPEHLLGTPTRFPTRSSCALKRTTGPPPRCLPLRTGSCRSSAAPRRCSARRGRPAPTLSCGRSRPRTTRTRRSSRRSARSTPARGGGVLCRTNARLTDYEELLHDAKIPFQGASLLGRDAARRIVRRLGRASGVPAGEAVRAAALEAGWLEQVPDSLGERELVRQADLARLVALAEEFDGDAAEFVDDLLRRFDPGGDGAHGVHLLTLHRAKGPSSTRCSCRGSRRTSSLRARPRRPTRSPRSDACSTSG